MDKKMENATETRKYAGVIILGLYRDYGKENGSCYSGSIYKDITRIL